MARFYIHKSNGEKEYFQDKKLLGSLLKASLAKKDAEEILNDVKKIVPKGATSDQIHQITYKRLCKTHLPHAQLYNLRKALADLPPKIFEKYVKKILEVDGYACEWERIVQGAGTRHEVDVVAHKDENCFLIECKRRSNWHRPSGLGKILVVQARYDDILDGYTKKKNKYKFTRPWVINNAKFSAHAQEYAAYKGMWLTGWDIPKGKGINEWIQHLQVYPVTILRLQKNDMSRLLERDIITFKDLEITHKKTTQKILSSTVYKSVLQQMQSIRQCTE
jgi:hypothetical protein